MLKSIIERLFSGHPVRRAQAEERGGCAELSSRSDGLGCIEGIEEDAGFTGFPETEACKLFMQCQWMALFYPGTDAETLRCKKYRSNYK